MLVLYNPPSTPQRKPVLPMSLLALGALLEGDHEYTIVDGNVEPDPVAAIQRAVRGADGAILGVTVMPGPQLEYAVAHSRQLKAVHPHLTVVWGGYFPTQHHDVCLEAEYVDYVVRGHGEVVFKELMEALRRSACVRAVDGLAYRDPIMDEVVINSVASLPHPASLPDFPYHRVDVEQYVRPTFMGQRTLAHHTSYGCPFRCNFCAVVSMADGRWKAQPAEKVATTTRYLVSHWGANAIEFYDNNFFVHEARIAEFAGRIMDLGIGWWAEARIDTLLEYSQSTWKLMRDSGLRMVFMGAESGSDQTLERMNKGGQASTDQTLEIARRMANYGIVPEMSFVLGNPPDAEQDIRQTTTFIRRLKRVNPATEIILYLYTPVPLSGKLYDRARAGGFKFPDTLDEWVDAEWKEFGQRRSARTPWVGDALRRQLRDFERVLNAYYPTVTDPTLQGVPRWLLRAVGAWRYHLKAYRCPVELRMLQKLMRYQRPETSGF